MCNSVIADAAPTPRADNERTPTHLERIQDAMARAENAGTNEAKLQAYEAVKELISPLFHQA